MMIVQDAFYGFPGGWFSFIPDDTGAAVARPPLFWFVASSWKGHDGVLHDGDDVEVTGGGVVVVGVELRVGLDQRHVSLSFAEMFAMSLARD